MSAASLGLSDWLGFALRPTFCSHWGSRSFLSSPYLHRSGKTCPHTRCLCTPAVDGPAGPAASKSTDQKILVTQPRSHFNTILQVSGFRAFVSKPKVITCQDCDCKQTNKKKPRGSPHSGLYVKIHFLPIYECLKTLKSFIL